MSKVYANELLLKIPEIKEFVNKGWKMSGQKIKLDSLLKKLGWKPPKHKMKPGGGKHKGGEWERETCRKLSIWWSGGEYNDLCWRTAGSGSKATMVGGGQFYFGDIGPVGPLMVPVFRVFSMDAKHYKELDITEVLRDVKKPQILEFWWQTKRDAIKSNRWPLLIYKVNFLSPLVAFDAQMPWGNSPLMFNGKKSNVIYIGNKIGIINFDWFLKNVNLTIFKEWLPVWEQLLHVKRSAKSEV
jgi:hypothetical protein